jgi:predicted RNase H-like HicB family nuclease
MYLIIYKRDSGGYLAWHPELRGCMSDGNTPREAVANLADARAMWVDDARANDLAIPAPRGFGAFAIDLENFDCASR